MKLMILSEKVTAVWLDTVENARKNLIELGNVYHRLITNMFNQYHAAYKKKLFKFLFDRFDSVEDFEKSEIVSWAKFNRNASYYVFGLNLRFSTDAREFISIYADYKNQYKSFIDELSTRWSVYAVRPFELSTEDVVDFEKVNRINIMLFNTLKKYGSLGKDEDDRFKKITVSASILKAK